VSATAVGATVEPGSSAVGSVPTDVSVTGGVPLGATGSGVPDSSVTTGEVAIAVASAVTTGDDTGVGGEVAADDAGNGDDGALDDGALDLEALCGTNEYDSRATGTCCWMRFATRRRPAGCAVAARVRGFTRGTVGAA
jgi:hypothetical protein